MAVLLFSGERSEYPKKHAADAFLKTKVFRKDIAAPYGSMISFVISCQNIYTNSRKQSTLLG
jgi:hypothetical protein